jgi:hypothetical protein
MQNSNDNFSAKMRFLVESHLVVVLRAPKTLFPSLGVGTATESSGECHILALGLKVLWLGRTNNINNGVDSRQ